MDFGTLSDAQAKFIKKYFKAVTLINREKSKAYNEGLVKEYEAFQKRCSTLRTLAGSFSDPAVFQKLAAAIAEADRIVGQNTKAPDIAGGHAQLDTVERVISLRTLANEWSAKGPAYEKTVEQAQKDVPIKKGELGATMADAKDLAARGLKDKDAASLKMALKRLVKIDMLIQEGKAELAMLQQAKSGKVEEFEKAAALSTAKPLFENEKTRFEQVKTSHSATFVPTLPPAIVTQNQAIERIISGVDKSDPASLTKAVAALKTEIAKLEDVAKSPIAGLAKWDEAIKPVEQRYKTLENHPLFADAEIVPLADAVRNDINAAKGMKGEHKYDEAVQALEGLVDKCSAAIKAADAKSYYDSIIADRKERADKLPASGTEQNPLVKAAIKSVEDHIAAAEAAAGETPPDYPKAIEQLKDVAEGATNAARLKTFATGIETTIVKALKNIETWGKDQNVAKAMKNELDRYKTMALAQRELAKTDIEGARAATGNFWMIEKALKAKFEQATAYYKEKAEFRKRFFEIEDHDGRRAVEEYYARLKGDGQLSDEKFAAGDLHMASALMKGSEKVHADMVKQADFGKAFFPQEKEVDEGLKELAKATNNAVASSLIGETTTLKSEAVNAGMQRRDWGTATSLIQEAKSRLAAAKALIEADKAVQDLKGDPALAAPGKDFAAAKAAYEKIRQKADAANDGAFDKKLQSATTDAAAAETEAKKEKPNENVVKSSLDKAIQTCQDVVALAAKKKSYDAAAAAAKSTLDSVVAPLNVAPINIANHLQTIRKALEDAANLAKPDGFNFDGAAQKVLEAQKLCASVPKLVEQRKAMSADVQKIKQLLVKLKRPEYAPGCDAQINRLDKLIKDIDTADKAFDLGKMKSLVAEGLALHAPFTKIADDYKTFMDGDYRSWAHIPGVAALSPSLSDAQFVDRARAVQFRAKYETLISEHNYTGAMKASESIYFAKVAAQRISQDYEAYVPDLAATKARVLEAKNKVDAEDGVNKRAVEALEARIAAAENWARKRFEYARAKDMLKAITDDCPKVESAAADFTAYKTKRDAAAEKLKTLPKLGGPHGLDPIIVRITDKHADAVGLATVGNLPGAVSLLDQIGPEVDAALLAIRSVTDFGDETDAIAKDARDKGSDLTAVFRTAEQQVEKLRGEEGVISVLWKLVALDKALKTAKALPAEQAVKAREDVATLMETLSDLRSELANVRAVDREMTALLKQLRELTTGHAHAALILPRGSRQIEALESAKYILNSDARSIDAAVQELEAGHKEYLVLKGAADAHASYDTLSKALAPKTEELEKENKRYAIQEDIVTFRTLLREAEDLAGIFDHKRAMELLGQAQDTYDDAKLLAKMTDDGVPTADEVKKILDAPGGDARLDTIVKALDPQAKRDVLRIAITARFGCQLVMMKTDTVQDDDTDSTGKALKGPNMMGLYKAMCKLPPADTLDNASLGGVTRVASSRKASDHHPDTKIATMREGEVDESMGYGVGLDLELDLAELDPRCVPVEGKTVRRFDWNTIHEVGHAVDDKLRYSVSRGGELAGWTSPTRQVRGFAETIAKHFKYDVDYVTRLMQKEADPAIPENPTPDTVDAAEWERRRIQVRAHVPNMFWDRDPWQTTAAAKLCEIDGICYHESQAGEWVSYKIEARKQGVTGYQFRSPLEWFSELYAAYHTEKMNPSHPAATWLKELKSPEEV